MVAHAASLQLSRAWKTSFWGLKGPCHCPPPFSWVVSSWEAGWMKQETTGRPLDLVQQEDADPPSPPAWALGHFRGTWADTEVSQP